MTNTASFSSRDLALDNDFSFNQSPILAESDDSSPSRPSSAANMQQHDDDESPTAGNAGDSGGETTQASSGGPENQQKRRRVTRACDECRKKKIKCDGKQPCSHCTVYGYDCTYDQPSHRRRNAAPQVVEQLEKKLKRAESLLKVFLPPDKDLSDPDLDSLIEDSLGDASAKSGAKRANAQSNPQGDGTLESMVQATANLDLDENGSWEYKGHSSGLSFIRAMRAQFGDILGSDDPDGLRTFASPNNLQETRSSPDHFKPSVDSPFNPSNEIEELPDKKRALELCRDALEDAGAIILIVHKPTFYAAVDKLYSKTSNEYDSQDHSFLPLLYSVLAVACLFSRGQSSDLTDQGYEPLMTQGYKYFWAARMLLDVCDCREMVSLQALVFMTYFLQCSAKLSTCYTFVGLALRTAMRMGLHRCLKGNFTPIEAETRRRVFWIIRKFDVYVGSMIGLPQALSEEEIDQCYPTAVNDEYITENGILEMPEDEICFMEAMNANFRMTNILRKINKYIYPTRAIQDADRDQSRKYTVSVRKIREIETDLQQWEESLPVAFTPGGECEDNLYRVRGLLRMSYALSQLMLYRPFLHYVSTKHRKNSADHRAYACAAASVSVARNVIHITGDMKKRGLLGGSYWFTMYTTFFAILTLVYYVLENLGDDTTPQLWREAVEGRDTLEALSRRSLAADRCAKTLSRLFKYVNEAVEKHGTESKTQQRQRKRPTNSSGLGMTNVKTETLRKSSFTQQTARKARELNLAPKPSPNSAQKSGLKKVTPQNIKTSMPQQDAAAFVGIPSPSVDLSGSSTSGTYAGFDFPDELGGFDAPSQGSTYGAKLVDMTSMMFPSADPFAYPNQPMLTIEQGGEGAPNSFAPQWNMSPPMVHSLDNADVNGIGSHQQPKDDTLDVHMFGPLPDYLMQHQPSPQQPQHILQSQPAVHHHNNRPQQQSYRHQPQQQQSHTPGQNMFSMAASMSAMGDMNNHTRGSIDFHTIANAWPDHSAASTPQLQHQPQMHPGNLHHGMGQMFGGGDEDWSAAAAAAAAQMGR